ncbi:unnamed protein product [Fraxinus pennsylvanica]|uniref:Uncharacterized protein n=1 Tax=Fraxinus pennsylvanica TaxID=56036 RepID=A0AAD2DJV3_9LAMI|nr:unnamed protein product [Fraxinus pennsylvanica]
MSNKLSEFVHFSKRHRDSTVLDEDTYVAVIEKIIERDFFPDIPKLQDRLDWLQAVRSHDPLLIRDAQLKILDRRRLRKESTVDASFRATTSTPGSTFFRNTSVTPSLYNENKESLVKDEGKAGNGDGEGEEGVDTSMSLDDFFRKYTSEDKDNFSRLIEKVNRKRKEKEKHEFLLEGEKRGDDSENLIEDGDKREQITTYGYGTSDQPVSTLEGWKYTAKNLLMYHPADRGEAPLTPEERAIRLKGALRHATEAKKAIEEMHGKLLEGRVSFVEVAKSRAERCQRLEQNLR